MRKRWQTNKKQGFTTRSHLMFWLSPFQREVTSIYTGQHAFYSNSTLLVLCVTNDACKSIFGYTFNVCILEMTPLVTHTTTTDPFITAARFWATGQVTDLSSTRRWHSFCHDLLHRVLTHRSSIVWRQTPQRDALHQGYCILYTNKRKAVR